MESPNLSYIKNLSGGDIPFETKVIRILKEEFAEEKKTYYENLKKGDLKLTASNVHKLKHKLSILSLEKGYQIAETFENNLRENNTDLSKEFDTILNTITTYLKQL